MYLCTSSRLHQLIQKGIYCYFSTYTLHVQYLFCLFFYSVSLFVFVLACLCFFVLFYVCIASHLSCYKAFTLLQSRSDIFCILLRHTVNLVTAVWVANNLFYVYILINHYSVFNLDFCKVISSPHRVKYKRLLTGKLGGKACVLRGAV